MDYEQRSITVEEVRAFRQAVSVGFGSDAHPDDDDRFLSLLPLDRTVAVFENGEIVGTLGDFPLVVTVPGGAQLDMAGTTMVAVRSTHTRRGILRSMVKQHLDDARSRGEALAGLWASEPGIYGRFGFGLAVESHEIKIDCRRLTPPQVDDDITLSMIPGDLLLEVVAPFWSSVAAQRSGFIERDEARWRDLMKDPEHRRSGQSSGRHIVARRADEVVGYLSYRQQSKWDNFVAEGQLGINALVAADPRAHRALWAHALSVDLFPNVRFWGGAVDDPMAYQVDNARAVTRVVGDALYVRVLDVARALEARTYECDGSIVMAIEDGLGYCGGTYQLVVEGGVGAVSTTNASADVTLDVRELGAFYLGRQCADMYNAAGRLAGSADSIRTVGQMFGTARAPWCPEEF